jgi:hypothetical protein
MKPCGIVIAASFLTQISCGMVLAVTSDPIAWRENLFSIPFRVNRSPAATDAPTEVRLFVSVDQGRNWSHAATVEPKAESFVYRAPQDGLYSFAIRSVDRNGNLVPDEPLSPELAVSVDTQPPQLDLTASAGPSGEVVLRWHASDGDLNPESLKIDVRCGDDRHWQPLAIGSTPPGTERQARSGEATWVPTKGCRVVLVRAEVQDRAGNPAVRQVQVTPSDIAGANRPAELTGPSPPPQETVEAAQPVAQTHPVDASSKPVLTPSIGATPLRNAALAQWPADRAVELPLKSWLEQSPDAPLGRDSDGRNLAIRGEDSALDVNVQSEPSTDSQQVPRWFSVGVLELDYELPDALPASPVDVELWGTFDGGSTWQVLAVDTDRTSPLTFSVDRECILGVRIALAAQGSQRVSPPAAGDRPELWIGIDRTAPRARILATRTGSGSLMGQALIDWEVVDQNLPLRPARLQYSPHRGGPWSTVAEGLPVRGRHAWRPPLEAPAELFFRLEVHDAAGNVSSDVTAEPLRIDRGAPQGLLRNVRPAASS